MERDLLEQPQRFQASLLIGPQPTCNCSRGRDEAISPALSSPPCHRTTPAYSPFPLLFSCSRLFRLRRIFSASRGTAQLVPKRHLPFTVMSLLRVTSFPFRSVPFIASPNLGKLRFPPPSLSALQCLSASLSRRRQG